MKTFLFFPILMLAVAPMADAQASPTREFEAATVKLLHQGDVHSEGIKVYPGGRLVIGATNLKALVAIAFRLSYWQISGGDAWIEKDKYDVEAKPSENISNLRYTWVGVEDEHLREMLQTLLVDRFQLKYHRETKTGKVYLLERKGGAIRLRPTEAAASSADLSQNSGFSGDIGFAGGRYVIFNTSMPQLAKHAADFVVHAPVLDQTGLSGFFDYKQLTAFADSEVNYSDPSGPFLLLIPELGLKLEPAKGPIETLLIDHAEKPSSN
jgi:uncharacterized protein (TIGR03435 family)